jgi:pyridoxal phosphate enzyme (YggS family)
LQLSHNIQQVEDSVAKACARAGRDRSEVQIIAVTKYVSLETTGKVLDLGMTHIGENRWQDVQPKWEAFKDRGTWHFIGHLQTNKVKDVVGKFAYIHSLDRLSLAKEIDKKAGALGIQAQVFLQINISGEESKYGMAPGELPSFIEQLRTFRNIRAVGLMTMAPYDADPESARPVFRGLRQLRDELNREQAVGYELPHLSMGMSGDFEVAIEEGATWVRLGSILVGKEG